MNEFIKICNDISYSIGEPNEASVLELIYNESFLNYLSEYVAKQGKDVLNRLRDGKSIYHGTIRDYVYFRMGQNVRNPIKYINKLLYNEI